MKVYTVDMTNRIKIFGAVLMGMVVSFNGFSQASFDDDPLGQDGNRIITTAVPFLTISPDARGGGMADIGAATSPDIYSIHWNPAKLVFIETEGSALNPPKPLDMGFSISFTPWLKRLVNDMYITNLVGFRRLRKEEVLAFSLTYFDLGDMQFRDENGELIKDFNPKEFSFGTAYSRKLSEKFSISAGMKFIHSNLSGNLQIGGSGGTTSKPGNTAAVDVGIFYKNHFPTVLADYGGLKWSWGAVISNLGAKISYTNNDQADFIPTNLRLGTSGSIDVDDHNRVSLSVDVNKLLVPTPPVYLQTDDGSDSVDTNGDKIIVAGKNPDRSFLQGVFGSFTDAPGGFKEEMQEFIISVGAEYWYDNLLAVRAGYFSENANKGNRKYFTLGVGIRYKVTAFDFAYLIPQRQNHPLAETLRFSLAFNFERTKQIESSTGN